MATIAKYTDIAHRGFYALHGDGTQVSGPVEESPGVTSPAFQSLLDAGVPIADYVALTPSYEDQRAAEYPKIGDQLDAYWKQQLADRAAGKTLEPEADAMLNAVLAVKAKYPKPT